MLPRGIFNNNKKRQFKLQNLNFSKYEKNVYLL